ncbi:hypothetical protein GALMADRAFT_143419 [Galerina marginata CBS 339.88]|uniref:Uncharacterized protein n=1 Tax=Galerina marginata (strain CBS 339.88) TaxID=685588 RepID=A0A067SPW6_GALM3|nr:hypothetical protein GALMADRAFT_143419 [Galerina marginata CBS 339.88]
MKVSVNIVFIAATALFSAKANAAPVVEIGRGLCITEPLGRRYTAYIPSEQVADLREISARIDEDPPTGL